MNINKTNEYINLYDLSVKLFKPIIDELIDSNNTVEIYKYLDYMKANMCYIPCNQFLHSHLFVLSNTNKVSYIQKNISIDYDMIDNHIESIKKQVKLIHIS